MCIFSIVKYNANKLLILTFTLTKYYFWRILCMCVNVMDNCNDNDKVRSKIFRGGNKCSSAFIEIIIVKKVL